jgi:hypothetical protein
LYGAGPSWQHSYTAFVRVCSLLSTMVLRSVRPSSPSPSIDRHYLATDIKSKLQYNNRVPPSPNRTITSRYATPISQRSSPAKPRLTYAASREERRDHAPSHGDGETVCDYDTSATVLYELLESSTWERARARCRSHPDEVRTWIVRKDKSLAVRWKLLPLHAAIIFQSPNFLVSALLEQYPAACARKDDQGMLPLHLAFRHKQEDEDLLELLLVKYPKAVMIKDRRDRVPLEHGRESKFSAKLMRLYADAVTAASQLVGGKGSTPTSAAMVSGGILTAGERALLEKDHNDEIAALMVKYEGQIQKLKGLSSEQVQSLEYDTEKRIKLIRADYEAQIRKLKDSHEERFATMRETHQTNLHHVELAAEEAHQIMSERHAEEVNELRELLNGQVNQDKEISDALEKEMAHLQVALQERRAESELTAKRNNILQEENEDLRDLLSTVQQQHVKLQEMLAQQQEDIEANRSIRNQLVQTLMRHDDGDKGKAMMDVTDKLRRKIAQALEAKQASCMERDRIHRDREDSRLERDRVERQERAPSRLEAPPNRLERDRVERMEAAPSRLEAHSRLERDRGQHMVAAPSRLERARRDDVEEKRSMLSRNHEEYVAPSTTEEYGEVRILADEISAITDTSDY